MTRRSFLKTSTQITALSRFAAAKHMWEQPALEFVTDLYSDKQVDTMMQQFREKGWVILPDVLKRETVDPFVAQLEKIMVHNGLKYTIPDDSPHYIHCAHAPRGRQVLPSALSHSRVAKPMPALHTTIIIIQTKGDSSYIPEWHKDREPDGMAGEEYHYPLDVFLAFYFEDMTDDHGPTLVIPGSHRDVSMTPQGDVPVDAIYCRKQDALLIDQRTWHRGTPRKVPGTRFLIVYGMYAMPHFYGTTFHMPLSQRKAWFNARSLEERVFFGGPFAPPDREALEQMLRELEASPRPKITFPRQT
jgi:hypothetical protein